MTLAQRVGFSETEAGQLALIVTECGTNIIKHTPHGGQVAIRSLTEGNMLGVEVIALDKGPGIANIGEALRDGFSTVGSAGTGLGAIRRLSTVFDLWSRPDAGTALLAQLWRKTPSPELSAGFLQIGVICVPKLGEEQPGDSWSVLQNQMHCRILVVDGLGHGVGAADAARAALNTFTAHPTLAPDALVHATHQALKHTRGAVMAIADIDNLKREVRFVGVGNIDSAIYLPESARHMVSHNGTVGFEIGPTQEFVYDWSEEGVLIMNSDGCTSQLSLKPYIGLSAKHPTLIASVLYRDFNRGNDDVIVLVAKSK